MKCNEKCRRGKRGPTGATGAQGAAGSNNLMLGISAQASSPTVSNEITFDGANITGVRFTVPTDIPIFANNAAALGGGLVPGMWYRTGGDPDFIAIVH